MREYRNITDTELAQLGVVRNWDKSIANTLQPGANLLWVHNYRKRYNSLSPIDKCLIRTVEIIKIDDFNITTNFGKYSLQTGRNINTANSSMYSCDCYGRLYLPKALYTT